MLIARLSVTSSQTDTELVAAPAAGDRIEILGLFIMSDGSNDILFYADDGTTLLHRQKTSAASTTTLPPGSQPWDKLPAGENLTVTSTSNVKMFIKVMYQVVSV